jgi:cell division protein FtsQ
LAVDPRIAARWISVRRDQNRRRQRVAIAVLSVVTALVAVWILARSPVLAVQHVMVRGAGHSGQAAVLAAAALAGRPPMLEVDLAGIRERVEALPWVARADVGRDWPNTVTIGVTERVPLAQVGRTAGQLAIVDGVGRVLAVGEEASRVLRSLPGPLPAVLGVPPVGPAGTMVAPTAREALTVALALPLMLRSPPSNAASYAVSAVSREGDGTLTVALVPGDITVVIGSTDQLAAKLAALRSVLGQLTPRGPVTVDVRVPEAPVLTDDVKSSSLSTTRRG